jgi:hypothetical protein
MLRALASRPAAVARGQLSAASSLSCRLQSSSSSLFKKMYPSVYFYHRLLLFFHVRNRAEGEYDMPEIKKTSIMDSKFVFSYICMRF